MLKIDIQYKHLPNAETPDQALDLGRQMEDLVIPGFALGNLIDKKMFGDIAGELGWSLTPSLEGVKADERSDILRAALGMISYKKFHTDPEAASARFHTSTAPYHALFATPHSWIPGSGAAHRLPKSWEKELWSGVRNPAVWESVYQHEGRINSPIVFRNGTHKPVHHAFIPIRGSMARKISVSDIGFKDKSPAVL